MKVKDLIKHLTKLEQNSEVFIKERDGGNYLSILSIEQEFQADTDDSYGNVNLHIDISTL